MQTYIREKLSKYAQEKEEILALFYLKERNTTQEFTEVYTVVSDVIVSKMQEELSSLFDDVILTNKKRNSFKFEKKNQNYTILEIFKKDSTKITENIISREFVEEFIKNLPNDIEFLYDNIDLKEFASSYRFNYDLPKEYEFEECVRNFFSLSLETSFLLLEKNNLSAANKIEKLRDELLKMLNWYIIERFSKNKSAGKDFENLSYVLEEDYKNLLLEVYSNADILEIYHAIFKACQLFRKLGLVLSSKLSFDYLKRQDAECMKLLRENYKKIESLVL